jgi:hypothetical protein
LGKGVAAHNVGVMDVGIGINEELDVEPFKVVVKSVLQGK